MRKLMVAALGISLLSGTAVFAQNTSTDTAGTMSKKKKKPALEVQVPCPRATTRK